MRSHSMSDPRRLTSTKDESLCLHMHRPSYRGQADRRWRSLVSGPQKPKQASNYGPGVDGTGAYSRHLLQRRGLVSRRRCIRLWTVTYLTVWTGCVRSPGASLRQLRAKDTCRCCRSVCNGGTRVWYGHTEPFSRDKRHTSCVVECSPAS